jgi:uncharacterized protein YmfQ (DUF2313 family)
MGDFFKAVKALFPQSRAFQLFVENKKYKLVQALCELPENVRREGELVYFDLFPDTTRFPEKWEKVFALFFTKREYEKRREIIDSMWKLIHGGQSAEFLQDVLQCIDKGIRVVENVPTSNPRHSSIVELCVNGHRSMRCGNRKAICNFRRGEIGFTPTIIQNDATADYNIPFDTNYWEFCFFICKSAVRNNRGQILYIEPIVLDAVWRNYVEYIILKIKPVQSTAIVFIDWQETEYEILGGSA